MEGEELNCVSGTLLYNEYYKASICSCSLQTQVVLGKGRNTVHHSKDNQNKENRKTRKVTRQCHWYGLGFKKKPHSVYRYLRIVAFSIE